MYASRAKALLEAKNYAGAARECSRALNGVADVAVVQGRALLLPLIDKAKTSKKGDKLDLDVEEAYASFTLALTLDKDNKEAAHELEQLDALLQCTSKREVLKFLGVLPDNDVTDDGSAPPHDAKGADDDHHDHSHHHDHNCSHGHDHSHRHPKAAAVPDAMPDVDYDVVIVGAGAAGIGCAITLTASFGLDPSRVLLIERGEAIGQSFRMCVVAAAVLKPCCCPLP